MKVDFPDAVWGRLASIADNRGMKIADLIVASAQQALDMNPKPEPCTRQHVPLPHKPKIDRDDPKVAARIRELRAMHRSVEEIAVVFGVGHTTMRKAMRGMNIPTNSRSRTNKGETA